jgi:uncharacterized protein involved in outer membrane biogenesis
MRRSRYAIVALLIIVLVVAILVVLAPDLLPWAWHRVKGIIGDII